MVSAGFYQFYFNNRAQKEQHLNKRKTSYPNLATCLVERDDRAYADGDGNGRLSIHQIVQKTGPSE
jgi:hypothetical protein